LRSNGFVVDDHRDDVITIDVPVDGCVCGCAFVCQQVHRWRKLEGSDPKAYEMLQKIQTLQKRLIQKTEEVVEKVCVRFVCMHKRWWKIGSSRCATHTYLFACPIDRI
jgi:hypothetical protein